MSTRIKKIDWWSLPLSVRGLVDLVGGSNDDLTDLAVDLESLLAAGELLLLL